MLAHYCVLEPRVAQLRANMPSGGVFDLNQLGALDTAGATLLALLLGEDRVANLRELAPKLPEERRILLET
ncbi:ABC transporter permease, partial [Escherichia coli]|nr:ABC transporter permease [Escherichia coli]